MIRRARSFDLADLLRCANVFLNVNQAVEWFRIGTGIVVVGANALAFGSFHSYGHAPLTSRKAVIIDSDGNL